jgi:hypothetical protein
VLRSRLTWIIVAALVALVAVAALDALRSPEEATSAAPGTVATTAGFSPTTTVVSAVDDVQDAQYVLDQTPENAVDEAGNPLPACTREQITLGVHARKSESNAFAGMLIVSATEACLQAYPYFRVAIRDSAGKQLLLWSGRLMYLGRTPLPQDDWTYADFDPVPCKSGELFVAFVTVGYDPTPRGRVFRREGICG